MRIISGSYRGKQIRPPGNFKARPTTDFAKEALFNIIENHFDISELSVLDLFSGTGSISYEFASRGAKRITAVEKDQNHFKFIRNVVNTLEIETMHIIRTDAFRVIMNPWEAYDIIFADPPFDLEEIQKIPRLILDSKLLDKDGWLILEHSSKYNFANHPELFDRRNYGSVYFSFFKAI